MSTNNTRTDVDPYVQWLGLATTNEKANYYKLLGIPEFESEQLLIKQAYYRRVAKVSLYQRGETATICHEVLQQLAVARDCLVDDASCAEHDLRLRRPASGGTPGAVGIKPVRQSQTARRAAKAKENSVRVPAPPPSRSPFGMLSVVRSPAEIMEDIISKRGLTPYQAARFVEQDVDSLVLGPYVIENELGFGSSGNCFLAARTTSGEVASIRSLSNSFSKDDERKIKACIRAVRQISSDRFQQPIEVGFDRHRDIVYLASEFVPGEDLDRLVKRRGPLSPQKAILCIARAVEGLATAIKADLTHLELRPSKMLIDKQGGLKIRDLALSQLVRHRRQECKNVYSLIQITPHHHLDYHAPESLVGEGKPSFRADIYSLGCIFYFLLTGEPIFKTDDPLRLVIAHREAAPPRLSKKLPQLSEGFDKCLSKMLAKRPLDRFDNYGQLYSALKELGKALPQNTEPVSQQWNDVDDTATIDLISRPAIRRVRLSRLIAIGSMVTVVLGGSAVAGGYYFWPKSEVTEAPDHSAQISTQPENKGPRILQTDSGNHDIIEVESEDSFEIRQ